MEVDYSGVQIGKYRLLEKLGNGSFGTVYSAKDQVLHTNRAIKIMRVSDPHNAQKLFEEAAIPYKCKHNNIVQINGGSIEIFDEQPLFIIDMELINGGSLEDLIKNNLLTISDALKYIKDALFGLQHSHANNIVHRDIKPANILIANGTAKLTDFGLASVLNQALPITEKWYKTHSAPEIMNSLTPTVKTDIFAIGVTMYRAVNDISNWINHLENMPRIEKLLENGTFIEKAPFEPYVPKKVIRIIKKACKADPEKRYVSAAQMRDDIEKLKILCRWTKLSSTQWVGSSKNRVITIEVLTKRKCFDVIVKINNRRSSKGSNSFVSLQDAQAYMHTYISENTVQ